MKNVNECQSINLETGFVTLSFKVFNNNLSAIRVLLFFNIQDLSRARMVNNLCMCDHLVTGDYIDVNHLKTS